ncbi:MAG: sporulation transcriptional regulator SpoIIID [Clostridia bacterium]|nr:sporulation transcriptional regulator SpoIIID [Clostridia bacterium]
MVYISESKERCIILGEYLVANNSTVRAVANKFGISKSTVHKDITQILKTHNQELFKEVKAVLEKNKQERHLRGGNATKLKYEKLHRPV